MKKETTTERLRGELMLIAWHLQNYACAAESLLLGLKRQKSLIDRILAETEPRKRRKRHAHPS